MVHPGNDVEVGRDKMRNLDTRLTGVLASGALLLVSACVSNTSVPPMLTSEQPGVLEPVYAAAVAGDVAVVRVASNGCTTKADLHPYLAREGGVTVMTVRRVGNDVCQNPREDSLELQWTFEELGVPAGTLVSVSNPFPNRDDDSETGQ